MYNVFDAHCDTAYELYADNAKGNFRDNIIHFSVQNTLGYNKYIQLLALWANPDYDNEEAVSFMKKLLEATRTALSGQEIEIIKESKDFEYETGFKAILGIEGGRALYNDPENLYFYYENGVRCLTLTWNGINLLGYGSDTGEDKGLTDFGRDILKRMNELNMVTDVSHLNEKGFYEVAELSDKPFIASHSNSKTLCGHCRNLTDEQFKIIVEKGGVAGINLCCDFLAEDGNGTIEDVVRHIDHFMELGGENHIGIGSDFDGVPKLPWGIEGNSDLYKIFNELGIRGYTKEQIDKISFGNFERVFKEVI